MKRAVPVAVSEAADSPSRKSWGTAALVTKDAGEFLPDQLSCTSMPTRFLIVGALITALVILVGVGLWFLLGIL